METYDGGKQRIKRVKSQKETNDRWKEEIRLRATDDLNPTKDRKGMIGIEGKL